MDPQTSANQIAARRSILSGKRILIVGAGGDAVGERLVQQVRHTRELGIEIVLLDTEDSRVAYEADVLLLADITDYAACRQEVERFHAATPLEGIVTFAEERTEITSRLQRDLGFPGHSVTGSHAARDKHRMREILREYDLPVPQFAQLESRDAAHEIADSFPVPAFLKTADGAGSVATRRIDRTSDIVAAFDDALHEIKHVVPAEFRSALLGSFSDDRANFLIEEYLSPAKRLDADCLGRVTIELLVQNGDIRFFAMADGRCVSKHDHRYSTLCFPSKLGAEDTQQFRTLAQEVVAAFGLSNGPVILDAVMTENGPQLYEINARIDNALVLPLITVCWGVDMVEETLKIAAGIPIDTHPRQSGAGAALIHFILAPSPATIARFTIPDWPGLIRHGTVTVLKHQGDTVAGPEGAYDCIALVEAFGDDQTAAEKQLDRFLSGMKLELTKAPERTGPTSV